MSGYYNLTRNITVPIGEGEVDYPTFFKALRKIGYEDYLAYEICSPIRGGGSEENLDRCAKQSLAQLKKFWEESSG